MKRSRLDPVGLGGRRVRQRVESGGQGNDSVLLPVVEERDVETERHTLQTALDYRALPWPGSAGGGWIRCLARGVQRMPQTGSGIRQDATVASQTGR